jgi:hypothetical protein
MSSPDRDPADWPNPEAKRYPRPGEPSQRFQAAVVAALLACGWLGVAVSGLCTAGFMNLAGGGFWRGFLTIEGFLGGILFLVMFGFVPIGGGIAMLIFTRRAWRKRR